jgi:non-homologous end joining protein Ku
MAPRPNLKGFLKLSLVSCAVALYPATSTSHGATEGQAGVLDGQTEWRG